MRILERLEHGVVDLDFSARALLEAERAEGALELAHVELAVAVDVEPAAAITRCSKRVSPQKRGWVHTA